MCCTNCVKCGKSTCHLDPKPSQIGMGFLFNAITLALQNTFETLNGMLLYFWLFFSIRDEVTGTERFLWNICCNLLVYIFTNYLIGRLLCKVGHRTEKVAVKVEETTWNTLASIWYSSCDTVQCSSHRDLSGWFMYTRLELLIKASDFFRFLTM